MSRKFSGLSKTARSVSKARCFETEYSNVSGMFPRGAQPTHIGDTNIPVRPRGRRDEGSGTAFSFTDYLSCEETLQALPRSSRRLFGFLENLLDVFPEECFAEALPDGVLHRRIIGVFRRD